ncbi:type VII secretion target [Mycolicibacterium nivoides]|uniref:type VII secretion target n=1 Tax=Mycolicibacterium nivoides TaxID=2487344 RepID=UPI003C2FE42F
MTGELRVNIAELRAGALGFRDAADALPDPPSAIPSLGTDRLAQALTNRTNEVESSLHDTMPTTRSDARTTANNIGTAADRYEKTDQQAHSDVNARLAEFDSKFGSSDSGGGGGMDAMGQFGQLMQMPMQMAQQLGQVPMQMAQQLGQIPQTIMQSVQQLGQMGGGLGQGGAGAEGAGAGAPGGLGSAGKQEGSADDDRDDRGERKDEGERREGAAAPDGGAQRAPAAAGPSAEAAPAGPGAEAAPAQPTRRPPVDPSVLL